MDLQLKLGVADLDRWVADTSEAVGKPDTIVIKVSTPVDGRVGYLEWVPSWEAGIVGDRPYCTLTLTLAVVDPCEE